MEDLLVSNKLPRKISSEKHL